MTLQNLYFCHTPFHLYLSLLKVLTFPDTEVRAKILISDSLAAYEQLLIKQFQHNNSVEVLLIKDMQYSSLLHKYENNEFKLFSLLKRRSRIKKIVKEVGVPKFDYNNSIFNVFNDSSTSFTYFFDKFDNINLIEDGNRLYEKIQFGLVKHLLFHILKLPSLLQDGRYAKIRSIEAVAPQKLERKRRKKAIVLDISDMISKLTRYQISKLWQIFSLNGVQDLLINIDYSFTIILITQPLSEDGIMTEEQKIELYKNVLLKYPSYNVILKKHPREKTNYALHNLTSSNIIYLPHNFPVELIDFIINDKIHYGITYNSSALKNIKNIKNKIQLKKQ